MSFLEVDNWLGLGGADVAGDVEVVVVLNDLIHAHAAGVAFFFRAVDVGVNDFFLQRQNAVG